MAYRAYSGKGSRGQLLAVFSSAPRLSGKIRGMRDKIISVAISVCALAVILVVRLITLFWRQREAPEISLRDVE
jgi:hypothetical protein